MDPLLRDELERLLFRRWLAEQRKRACIEWYWGAVPFAGGAV
jgi:hypothetical protein